MVNQNLRDKEKPVLLLRSFQLTNNREHEENVVKCVKTHLSLLCKSCTKMMVYAIDGMGWSADDKWLLDSGIQVKDYCIRPWRLCVFCIAYCLSRCDKSMQTHSLAYSNVQTINCCKNTCHRWDSTETLIETTTNRRFSHNGSYNWSQLTAVDVQLISKELREIPIIALFLYPTLSRQLMNSQTHTQTERMKETKKTRKSSHHTAMCRQAKFTAMYRSMVKRGFACDNGYTNGDYY